MNGSDKEKCKEVYETDNFDSFVKIVSFHSSWIGAFGIWEDDCFQLILPNEIAAQQLDCEVGKLLV